MAPRMKSKEAAIDPVPAPIEKRAKKSAVAEFDDLSDLAVKTKAMEDEIRAQTGGSNSWLRVLQSGVDIITKGTADFIKGAEAGDFFLADKKLVLKDPEITILGMFKVYAEKKPGAKENDMSQTVGFWLPQDAEQIPTKEGSNFERSLRNGNTLVPMHWMFVYIHEHPEITDALIPFQSIGNGYFSIISKMIKKSCSLSTELRLKLSCVGEKNEDYNKTYFYPEVTVLGKNFDFDAETGKVSICKGGLKADEVREILTRSNEAQKAYKELKMVSKRSEQALLALIPGNAEMPRKGLPGAKGAYKEEADEESPKF
jgi:hypothetical protein